MAKKTNSDDANSRGSIGVELPKGFEKSIKARYEKIKDPEVSFSEFLEFEKQSFRLEEILRQNPAAGYAPRLSPAMTPCGNGDLESQIDTNEWQGAYGDVRNIPSSFVEGFISGPINDFNSHQTWVPTGPDPNVPISTTAPGSSGAVRIGNSVNGYGSELISKTFVVTPGVSTVTFWYAVVMQNPIGHPPSTQPLFWVRVTDAAGNIVPGAFDFGNGSDKLIADISNPFFKSLGGIVYRDWSCAQIDLSSQIGKQVTIEFISGDCGYGGHWGYAYIDRYCDSCEGSPTGTLNYLCEESTLCGVGQICFEYTLPETEDVNGNPVTGSVDIKLDVYQNGNLITSLSSPTLTTLQKYCFPIDPASLQGINLSLGGFDFVVTGEFAIGSFSLGRKRIGLAPDGITAGQNNDYQFDCKSCSDLRDEQESHLLKLCSSKVNRLEPYDCNCPDSMEKGSCDCTRKQGDRDRECVKFELPRIEPCIIVSWGDSPCDCLETTDFEVACITVCNCFENVTFEDFVINQIVITDEKGNPVDRLPNGKPSIEVVPSGPICFGDIGPCTERKPTCKSRELVIHSVGAKPGKYRLKLIGVCFRTRFDHQKDYCIDLNFCGD